MNLRTGVLLGVLAILVGAVAYDYLYAQPQAHKIHDAIFAHCDDSAAKVIDKSDNKPKLFTPKDIHQFLGEQFNGGKEYLPSKVTVVKPGHLVETYSVMAGAIIRTYDVHVIYIANDPESAKEGRSEARFSTLVLGEFPKGDLVPQAKIGAVTNELPPAPVGATMPQGPGSAPKGAPEEPKKDEEKKEGEKTEEPKADESEKKPESENKPEPETKPEPPAKEEPKSEEKPAEPKSDPEKTAEEKAASEQPKEEKPAEKPADPKAELPAEPASDKPSEPKN